MSTGESGSDIQPHHTASGDVAWVSELTPDGRPDRQQQRDVPNRMTPRWQCLALQVSGLQCLIWGLFIIAWPERDSRVYGFAEPPAELFLWQGMGLVIVLFGIGYLIASTNPFQHWAVVLIGLLSKSFGPIGMAWSVCQGRVSAQVLYLIPFNDLIWLIPFGLILIQVYKLRQQHFSGK